MANYNIDKSGKLINVTPNGDLPPPNTVETTNTPPIDGRQIWDKVSGQWLPLVRPYDEARRLSYPPVGDQLDAIWKVINQLRLNGTPLPQDGDNMLNAILQVKNDIPKP